MLSYCKTILDLYDRKAAWLPFEGHEKIIRAAVGMKVGKGIRACVVAQVQWFTYVIRVKPSS